MTLIEKKEHITNLFRTTFDKEMAYQSVGLSQSELDELEADATFQMRLEGLLILEKEKIIVKLRKFMDSEDERISFQATTDLGKLLYPELFKRMNAPVKLIVENNSTPEEQERRNSEYELLLGKKKNGKAHDSRSE